MTILDIALESGFGDVSNFNRAFKGMIGSTPRAYRGGGSSKVPGHPALDFQSAPVDAYGAIG
jgi:AraC-like DNA-binding protein